MVFIRNRYFGTCPKYQLLFQFYSLERWFFSGRSGQALAELWSGMQLAKTRSDQIKPLEWHYNERDGISNHHCLSYLLNHLFRCRSKQTSKLCVNGLCDRNPLVTGEFFSQRASNTDNVSIWWCHHAMVTDCGSVIIIFSSHPRVLS